MDGETVLAEAVAAYQVALGDRLLAAYALGSLAHGGFSALVSDVDLGLIVSDPIGPADAATVARVAGAEKAKRSELHARLSVFWGTPATLTGDRDGGRFPPLDRLDLLESGRLLAGSDAVRRSLPRPDTSELIVAGSEFALDYLAGVRAPRPAADGALASIGLARHDAVAEILEPERLLKQGVRRVTKLTLFPVRFLYTATTGRVGTNDAAVERYLEDRRAPSRELVAAARAWRAGDALDDAVALELLAAEMVPLYLKYVDDHIARLDALRRADLRDAFEAWRDLLAERRLPSVVRDAGEIARNRA